MPTDTKKPSDLDRTQEIFDFLQGRIPTGYKIPEVEVPHLDPEQAWIVVWYLGNLYWKIPDHIYRCDGCGCLFDGRSEGGHSDSGPLYHFCDSCDPGGDDDD